MKNIIKRIYSTVRNNRYIDKLIDQLIKIRGKYPEINKLIKLIGFSSFLKRLIYERHEEIIQEIDLNKIAYSPSARKLKVYPVERQHVPRLAELRKQVGIGGGDPAEDLKEYLDHGCKGFLAELAGEIIGYVWWGDCHTDFSFDYQRYEYYLQQAQLTSLDTYGFDFFIIPSYRGQGNALEFLSKYLLALRGLGYERNFGCVHSDNLAALWTYKVFGCKDIKIIVERRFFLFFLFKNSKYFYDDGIKWLFNTREIYKVNKGFRA